MKKAHKTLGEEVKRKQRELKEAERNYQDIRWFKNIQNVDVLYLYTYKYKVTIQ